MKKEKDNISKIKKLDIPKLNNLLGVGNNILKILYVLLILLLVYLGIILLREFNVLSIVLKVLSVISPLFIGFSGPFAGKEKGLQLLYCSPWRLVLFLWLVFRKINI